MHTSISPITSCIIVESQGAVSVAHHHSSSVLLDVTRLCVSRFLEAPSVYQGFFDGMRKSSFKITQTPRPMEVQNVVMVCPVDADHDQARHIPQVSWPKMPQLCAQRFSCLSVRQLNLKNEERDRDREDTITKSLNSLCRECFAHCGILSMGWDQKHLIHGATKLTPLSGLVCLRKAPGKKCR